MPKFVVHRGKDPSTSFWLEEDDIFIGRVSTINDICIHDPSVSRQHVHVKRREEGWTLYDLKSLNGVSVNGKKVTRALLQDQDRIQLGNVEIRFELREMTREEELAAIESSEQTRGAVSIKGEDEPTKKVTVVPSKKS